MLEFFAIIYLILLFFFLLNTIKIKLDKNLSNLIQSQSFSYRVHLRTRVYIWVCVCECVSATCLVHYDTRGECSIVFTPRRFHASSSHRPNLSKKSFSSIINSYRTLGPFLPEPLRRRLFMSRVYAWNLNFRIRTDVTSEYRTSFMVRKIREPSSISWDNYI